MDWLTWLSKTGLDTSLVHEYGLTFLHNELEEDDIPYLDHEFLRSMGISTAKHRLEILKVAKKETHSVKRHPMSRFLIAIRQTKLRFAKFLKQWNLHDESSLVPRRNYSTRWDSAMLKRNKKAMVLNKQSKGPFLLTFESSPVYPSSRIESFSSPLMKDYAKADENSDKDSDHDEYLLSSAVEEMDGILCLRT